MLKITTNKKGWVRIVEAFVAILFIAMIVLIVIEQDQNKSEDTGSIIYSSVISIARDIQLNSSLRGEIVDVSSLPLEWSEFNTQVPQTLERITNKTPSYLECQAKICATNDACLLSQNQDKEVFAESVIISSTINEYNPRILKIFCWEK